MNNFFRIWLAACLGLSIATAAEAVEVRVEGASERLQKSLENVLEDFPEPETRFEARRQAQRAADQLQTYLNSQAYFAATIVPDIEETAELIPVVNIMTGPRFHIGEISITYVSGEVDETVAETIHNRLSVRSGQLALPDDIVAAERAILSELRAAGFGDASIKPRQVLGDAEAGTIDIEYVLSAGPRLKFGKVRYETQTQLSRTYRDKLVPFAEGDVYSQAAMQTFDERLGETRIFDVFYARLADTPSGVTGTGEEIRDVVVVTQLRKRFSIALGGRFSTSEGIGATAEFLTRNLTGRGDPLRLTGVVADQELSLGAVWDVPHALGYGRSLSANGLVSREDTDAFDRTAALIGGGLDISRKKGLVLGFGTALEYSRETDATEQRDLFLLSASADVRIDKTDSLLDPSTGWRAGFGIEPVASFGDAQDFFFTTTASGSYYNQLRSDARFVLALRARLSSVIGADTSDLSVSRRLFAGGGSSARGFGFQEVGPLDSDGVPLGGRGLVELSSELRWRFNQTFGFAAFVDSASVSDDSAPDFDSLRVGVGAGVRYYTAIGPLRLDLGTPLNRRDGEDAVQVSISIGQAF